MVSLRQLEITDSAKIVEWRNNLRVRSNLLNDILINEEKQLEYFNKFVKSGLIYQFVIVYNNIDCGTTFLKNVNTKEKDAEFGIFIGEDNLIGRNISSEATKLTIAYGFEKLNLNSIYLYVLAENYVALKTYIKVGFVKEDDVVLKAASGEFKRAIKMRIQKNRI